MARTDTTAAYRAEFALRAVASDLVNIAAAIIAEKGTLPDGEPADFTPREEALFDVANRARQLIDLAIEGATP
jgi:hypothetical protein